MEIGEIYLCHKSGGKSGEIRNEKIDGQKARPVSYTHLLIKEYVDEEGGAEVEAGEEDIYKNADE